MWATQLPSSSKLNVYKYYGGHLLLFWWQKYNQFLLPQDNTDVKDNLTASLLLKPEKSRVRLGCLEHYYGAIAFRWDRFCVQLEGLMITKLEPSYSATLLCVSRLHVWFHNIPLLPTSAGHTDTKPQYKSRRVTLYHLKLDPICFMQIS